MYAGGKPDNERVSRGGGGGGDVGDDKGGFRK